VLQSTLEPKSERQESRATFVSVVTPRLNPNTTTATVSEKTLAEEPAAPAFLPATKETNDSENSSGPVQATASDPAVNEALFDPVAPFGEWLQALEDFRKRPQTGSRPSVYLADGDPHFAEPFSLDDQFPVAILSEVTLVVTEYGTI